MKYLVLTFSLFILFVSCSKTSDSDYHAPDWSARMTKHSVDSLHQGTTYLAVYPQIYQLNENRKVDLSATVSIRNIDMRDTMYISKIDYYNTEGKMVRKYLSEMIYVKPLETIEIVIKNTDNAGGTGAN